MYSQAYVRIIGPSVAVRNRGHCKGIFGKRMGPSEELRLQSKLLDGWKDGRPGVRLETEPSTSVNQWMILNLHVL